MFRRLVLLTASITFTLSVNVPMASAQTCDQPGQFMNLTNCSFKDRDLSNVDLTGSNLHGSDLTGTDLSSATLTNVSSGSLVGTPSHLPEGWQLIAGYLIGPQANLSNADFTNMDLTNASFVDTNLSDAILSGTKLTNADFDGATLTNVAGRGIVGIPVNLPAPWKLNHGILIGPTANLSGLDLSEVNLNNFDFTGANLQATVFSNVNLTDIDFTSNNILGIAFYNCNLTRTDFSGLDVEGIRAVGITGTPIGLPSNFKIISGFAIGPYANLSSLNLMNINLTGTNLHHASLSASNLTGANLANVDLTLTAFTGVNLTNANITNANLTGVNLGGVISKGLIGTPIGLGSEWQLYQGYLFGPQANLSSVDFSNKDLRDAHLRGVFFIGANLSGANLAGVDLTDTNLTGVLLSGTNLTGTNLTNANLTNIATSNIIGTPSGLDPAWRLANKYLIGPHANLNNADLAGLDLSGVDLTGASLLIADLSGANLSGANLTDAVITDANLTNANLLNVISARMTGTPVGLSNRFLLVGGKLVGTFIKSPIPKITGSCIAGKEVSVLPGTWDDGVSLSYTWTRNGVPIALATASKLRLQGLDSGTNVAVTVTGAATGGVTRVRTSVSCKVGIGTMKASPVTLTGKLLAGKQVSISVKKWVDSAKTAYTWFLDGKIIKGQTKATFKIPAKAKGHKLLVSVTQTAVGFKSATASSKPLVIH